MTSLPAGTGYFDLMSWQLLFVAGICFGFTAVPNLRKFSPSTLLTAVCLAVITTLFAIRRWHFLTGHDCSQYFEWLFHWKRTLPLGCLLNFAAFSFVVYRFRRPLGTFATTWPGKAVVFLGQHSLPVFVWSVSATMLVNGSGGRWIGQSFKRQPLAVTGLILASCFVPAWLHALWRASRHNWSNRLFSAFSFSLPATGQTREDENLARRLSSRKNTPRTTTPSQVAADCTPTISLLVRGQETVADLSRQVANLV